MLSFEERELARQFRDLGARIGVPDRPRRRMGVRVPVIAIAAALLVLLVVVITVARSDDTSKTTSPTSPSPPATPSATPSSGVIASATPSHRATPYTQVPPELQPSPGANYTIAGTVVQLGADGNEHPVSGARVDVFVNVDRGGYHWMTDVTDATGRYELWGIPARVIATVYASTYDSATRTNNSLQPCAHQIRMTEDVALDIDIVPISAGGEAATAAAYRVAARSLRVGGAPLLGGVVFERASDGTRIGVPNARVTIGGDMEPVIATTLTDAQGRYVVCDLPSLQHEFFAEAQGFRVGRPIPWNDGMQNLVDFEMSR